MDVCLRLTHFEYVCLRLTHFRYVCFLQKAVQKIQHEDRILTRELLCKYCHIHTTNEIFHRTFSLERRVPDESSNRQ